MALPIGRLPCAENVLHRLGRPTEIWTLWQPNWAFSQQSKERNHEISKGRNPERKEVGRRGTRDPNYAVFRVFVLS